MSSDPILSAETAAEHDAADDPRDDALSLVLAGATRPAVSYDHARELLPEVDELVHRLSELRGWLTYVIEQDCAANLRTELRIGEKLFTFKPGRAYSVERPDDLHAALAGRIAFGELTRAELDAAIVPVDVPARTEWRLNNARLNDLAKRGGEVAKAIDAHRLVEDTPATLKPKGR